MRIALSGSHGFIGSHLKQALCEQGHDLQIIERSDFLNLKNLKNSIKDAEVVIHLAGENIAGGRWSTRRKTVILESRVRLTRMLSETISGLIYAPRTFMTASAVGYYGYQSADICTEDSPAGSGFLADVCRRWEEASRPAKEKCTTIYHLRFGVVLGYRGGILQRIMPVFQRGLGSIIGSGNQPISWIAIDEIPRIINFLIQENLPSGPINCVSPEFINQRKFAQTLALAYKKPLFLRLPDYFIRLFFGQMGNEIMLGGVKAVPKRLQQAGYKFKSHNFVTTLSNLVRSQKNSLKKAKCRRQ